MRIFAKVGLLEKEASLKEVIESAVLVLAAFVVNHHHKQTVGTFAAVAYSLSNKV